MKSELLNKLIEVYCQHSVEEINNNGDLLLEAFNKQDVKELLDLGGYEEAAEFVKTQKKDFEHFEEGHDRAISFDSRMQVIETLKWLNMKSLFNLDDPSRYMLKMDTLRDLIKGKYAKNWNDKEKQHFDFLYPKIRDWNTCFFSYTRKGSHLLNSEYRRCLNEVLREARINLKIRDWKEKNLVAIAIRELLDRHNCKKIFFDEETLRQGDDLPETIKHNLGRSFLFVQLVTMDSFRYDKENWPFKEYKEFFDRNTELINEHPQYTAIFNSRLMFTICSKELEDLRPKAFPPQYEDWYDTICNKLYQYPTNNDVNQFLQDIENIAASVISFLEERLIQNIPN